MANLILNRPKVHLCVPDPHAHPLHNNNRADILGKLIADLKPDVLVNLGDQWDFPSLCSYDKGKKSFWGRAYADDLEAGLDFSERMWNPIRRLKKKMPYSVFLEGNHEERIKRLLSIQPELEGTVGFGDLDLKRDYDDIVEYNGSTPGMINVDGIMYCHYAVSGVMGRAIGGEHPGYSLLMKQFQSVTAGHLHLLSHATRTTAEGKRIHGLVAGVFQDYWSEYAGHANDLWWRGLVIKRNVEDGDYDLETVSMARLYKEYGGGLA